MLDNLNTHTTASLYATFAPAEARHLTKKPEFYYTFKHGNWLNMAEMELSILQRPCLDRRMPDARVLQRALHAYQERR